MAISEELRTVFSGAADFQERGFSAGGAACSLFFLDGLTSGTDLADFVLRPLCERLSPGTSEEVYRQAASGVVRCAVCTPAANAQTAAELLVNGYCALYIEGCERLLCFEVKGGEKRSPSAPESENTVKGAKDAFTETVRTNTALVRRHLRTPKLRLWQTSVGTRSHTNVTLLYIEDLTDPALVSRLQERLGSICIDGLVSPSAVEEYVTGSRRTAFPLLEYTERTDKLCQGLLAGRVGLLVDGLPLAYLTPVTLAKLMESQEDRAVDYVSASCLRVLRYAALLISLLLPALYAAMAMFHQEMLPTKLLLAIIESKKDVPFPTILEVLGILAAFELLQEAGLHLPQAIGTAVSIIGGLVVGTAAVDAKLVSPAALIVAASSGICGFTLPSRDLSDAIRVWRFALTIFAGLAGLYGVTVGFLLLVIHLGSLSSFGIPYFAPFSGARTGHALLRERLCKQKYRDAELHPQDMRNQA